LAVTAADVRDVRDRTGAGVLECKNALEDASGDVEAAIEALRKMGIAKGVKLAGRKTDAAFSQGLIESYIHSGGRIGVLLEVNCQTDFVARTGNFKTLAHDIALQIAAMDPQYTGVSDLPENPDEATLEQSLMHQSFVRDPSKAIKDLVAEAIGKLGENIRIGRFTRYELGS